MNEINQIYEKLSESEIDFRILGNLIFDLSKSLSATVNHELLEPISNWLDDPDFIKKYEIRKNTANWSLYKRKQREWTKFQKKLASNRLKIYWQEIRKKRELRDRVRKLLSGVKKEVTYNKCMGYGMIKKNFLSSILKPFCPIEQQRQKLNREFSIARQSSVSNILPWQIFLSTEINSSGQLYFSELSVYCENKADKIAKFQHLLQMEASGDVEISQKINYGKISICSKIKTARSEIIVRDQMGGAYHFDWNMLNQNQRKKIVADILTRKVICRSK